MRYGPPVAFLAGTAFGFYTYRLGYKRGWQARSRLWTPYFLQDPFKRMLRSKLCPGCGAKKGKMLAFCNQCFHSLPKSHKMNLDFMLKRGWIAAFEHSLAWIHDHRAQPINPTFAIFTRAMRRIA
jgi:hypothetical protein